MTNYIYDNGTLPFPKYNLAPLPSGADSSKWVQDSDWNALCQAVQDTKAVLRAAAWYGLTPGTDPSPSGVANYLWVDGTTLKLKIAGTVYPIGAGGGTMAIGGTITSATAGSVLFAGASGVLAQDNASFFWDASSKFLGIGTSAPGSRIDVADTVNGDMVVRIKNSSAGGAATGIFIVENNGGGRANMQIGSTGVDVNSYAALANRAVFMSEGNGIGVSYAARGVGSDMRFYTNGITPTEERMRITSDGGVEFRNSSGAGLSNANTGRLRYTTSGQKFQVSVNGGSYVDLGTGGGGGSGMAIGSAVTGGTSGSVLFVDASGNLAQDNTNLVWDDTNKVVTTKTIQVINSSASVSASNTGRLRYTTTGQKFQYSANGGAWADLVTPGLAIGTAVASGTSGSVLFVDASGNLAQDNTNLIWDDTNKVLGVKALQMINSSVSASPSNTGRIRYTTTGQKFQYSANGGAWTDLAGGGGGGGGANGLFGPLITTIPTQSNTGLASVYMPTGASVTDATSGILLKSTSTAPNTTNLAAIGVAAPATPYTITALVLHNPAVTGVTNAGLGFSDTLFSSSAAHCLLYNHREASSPNGRFGVYRFSNLTTFSSADFENLHLHSPYVWLRVRDDGTTAYFYYSYDGELFHLAYSVVKSSGLGGSAYNNIIVVSDGNAGQAASLVVAWAVS